MTAVVQLPIGDAHDLGCAALLALGLTAAEARSVVDHLIDNSLCGYRFAGLPRILAVADSPDIRRPRAPIAIEYETPLSARVDCGNSCRLCRQGFLHRARDNQGARQRHCADRRAT